MGRIRNGFNNLRNSLRDADIVVKYAVGDDAYEVVLGTDAATAQAVKNNPQINSKEGEERVAAIIEAYPRTIRHLKRFKNGPLNDGINGEPAFRVFTGKAESLLTMNYQGGIKQPNPPGPSVYQRLREIRAKRGY